MDPKQELVYLKGLVRVYISLTNPKQSTLKKEIEEEILRIVNSKQLCPGGGMEDTQGLGPCVVRRASSSLVLGTKINKY